MLLSLFFLNKINTQISQVFLISQDFWSYISIQNIQIAADYSVFDRFCFRQILFSTDSVFYVLFAYFDESMASIGGYEPWKSWNTVDITPI